MPKMINLEMEREVDALENIAMGLAHAAESLSKRALMAGDAGVSQRAQLIADGIRAALAI